MIRPADRWLYDGKKFPKVHRVAYIVWVGPIADGMTIDHVCRVRNCINPAHLEVATMRDNLMADGSTAAAKTNALKMICPEGHPLTGENVYKSDGRRHCRTCRAVQTAAYDARNRKARAEKARIRRANNRKASDKYVES